MLLRSLVFVSVIAIGALAAEEDVLDLGDDDFAHELERHENSLVMFYAPW